MNRIYTNADEVIIWLGTKPPEFDSVFRTIKTTRVTRDEIMQKSVAGKIFNLLRKKIFDDAELIALFGFSFGVSLVHENLDNTRTGSGTRSKIHLWHSHSEA